MAMALIIYARNTCSSHVACCVESTIALYEIAHQHQHAKNTGRLNEWADCYLTIPAICNHGTGRAFVYGTEHQTTDCTTLATGRSTIRVSCARRPCGLQA